MASGVNHCGNTMKGKTGYKDSAKQRFMKLMLRMAFELLIVMVVYLVEFFTGIRLLTLIAIIVLRIVYAEYKETINKEVTNVWTE